MIETAIVTAQVYHLPAQGPRLVRHYDLCMAHEPIIGAVLAGGSSTRMGQDKSNLRMPDGRMMIDHVIDALTPVCRKIVLVGTPETSASNGQCVIRDLRPACGPLGGLESLLASGLGSHFLVCPCDAPLISTGLVRMLLPASEGRGREEHASVFRRRGWERFECLPLFISADALSVVREQLGSGQLALWRAIERLRPRIVEIDSPQAELLRNVNTPEEFRALVG